jgi:hypothetical protein
LHSSSSAPKKNHDRMVQLAKEFTDIFRKHGEYFQLSNTGTAGTASSRNYHEKIFRKCGLPCEKLCDLNQRYLGKLGNGLLTIKQFVPWQGRDKTSRKNLI